VDFNAPLFNTHRQPSVHGKVLALPSEKIYAMIRSILSCLFISFLFIPFLFISSTQAQHTVIMKDGSQKNGEVKSISGPTLTFFTNGRPLEMLVSDVRTIHFYDEKKAAAASTNLRKTFKEGFKEIEYEMEGRRMIKFPKIGLGTKDEGVVVVDVTIDKYGNVLNADPGAPGTKTTDDKYLFVKAQSACQQAKFDNDPTAPLSTTGKIYVTFP
tara:strand:+ start:497 stop:1135 length:639 start_codon:yes stop_codon:yes gene_type:complete